jgi:hypothetical protein
MVKKIDCQTKTNKETQKVRVKIIKAPIVNTAVLRHLVLDRAKALVL